MGEDLPRITVEFDDRAALAAELEQNLLQGGAFLSGETSVAERSRCLLVLLHPDDGEELELVSEVVFVKRDGSATGTGLELVGFDDELAARLRDFASKAPAEPAAPKKTQNVHERVRQLSSSEQQKLARGGNYAERLALERAFGKGVWESLLQNPRLTHPEVARIARMGTLPGPQVEAIATNPGWLSAQTVRQALLSNPRLTGPLIERVLRTLPRPELAAVPKQMTYSTAVRNAARKLSSR